MCHARQISIFFIFRTWFYQQTNELIILFYSEPSSHSLKTQPSKSYLEVGSKKSTSNLIKRKNRILLEKVDQVNGKDLSNMTFANPLIHKLNRMQLKTKLSQLQKCTSWCARDDCSFINELESPISSKDVHQWAQYEDVSDSISGVKEKHAKRKTLIAPLWSTTKK